MMHCSQLTLQHCDPIKASSEFAQTYAAYGLNPPWTRALTAGLKCCLCGAVVGEEVRRARGDAGDDT